MATMQNTQAKSHTGPFSGYQAGQQTFGPQQAVQTSMGNFPTLQAYQQQQDAFVQQHLKNQSQYNQGLQSGQSPQRVPVMEAWKQAGENIQGGQYQGNPFQAGNVDAIMGMFNQYGIQAPQGFRDQLLQNLGQQSAPPMYQQQPAMTYPGGPMPSPAPAPQPWQNDPGYQRWRQGIRTDMRARGPEEQAALERALFAQYWSEQPTVGMPGMGQQPQVTYPGVPTRTLKPTDGSYAPVAPQIGYPGGPSNDFIPKFTDPTTGLPYGQSAPPMTYPGGPMTPPSATQPNPSDPWSYPLRPGMVRGPSGEQIMTREAREAEIRRMEQESGRTYVRPKAGVTNGGWLPPSKPKPGASISLNPEQAAAMKQYMASRQSGQAQPTPARTQGTPYRGRQR